MSNKTVVEPMNLYLNKEGILKEIDLQTKSLNEKMSNSLLPAAYFVTRIKLLERLKQKVQKLKFINLQGNDGWFYQLRPSNYSYKVELINAYLDTEGHPHLHTIIFTKVKARMLSPEEYGARYNIGAGSVRQWIRRGKLPDAVKIGSVWRISELSVRKERGYDFRVYSWDRGSCLFEDEMKFLNDYDAVSLEQLKDGNFYIIPRKNNLDNLLNILPLSKQPGQEGITMNTKEKESFELKLIENPLVVYQTMGLRLIEELQKD